MFSMTCPTCRHVLLHRGAPPPAASRCSNPDCATTYDATGEPTTTDPGPWPEPEVISETVSKNIDGRYHDQNSGGSWHWQRGTSTGPLT